MNDLKTLTPKWKQLFPNAPEAPDLLSNIVDFIAFDRTQCKAETDAVFKAVMDYGTAAISSKQGDADKAYRKIQAAIFGKKGDTLSDCSDAAARVYAISSLSLLDFNNFNPNFPMGTYRGVHVTANIEVALVASLLANEGKLQFIDPSWKTESAIGSKVRGAYACDQSMIYLDPKLNPINLGTTLLHEMDHFFRDKFITADEVKTEFLASDSNAAAGWSSFLLMDEALAIVQSTFEQRALDVQKVSIEVSRWSLLAEGFKKVTPYQLKNDVNFFSKDGPLSTLYGSCGQWGKYETTLLQNFLEIVFLRKNGNLSCGNSFSQSTQRDKIYGEIYDSYFPGTGPLTSSEQDLLSPANHGMELGQLATWVNTNTLVYSVDVLAFDTDPFFACVDDHGPGAMCVEFKLEAFADALLDLKSKLASPSPVCDMYRDAVQNGALNSYVGTQIGARPSTDGVRPIGPKSGVTNAVPDIRSETIRTLGKAKDPTNPNGSNNGVRPSLDLIRPCMDLQDQI